MKVGAGKTGQESGPALKDKGPWLRPASKVLERGGRPRRRPARDHVVDAGRSRRGGAGAGAAPVAPYLF